MNILLEIIGVIVILLILRKFFNREPTVEKFKRECINKFAQDFPEKYEKVKSLKKNWNYELLDSAHMGRCRDGGESDRQDNIRQDRSTQSAIYRLREEVRKARFKDTVRDYIYERTNSWREREKLYSLIMNSTQDRGKVVVIDDEDIGFREVSIENVVRCEKPYSNF
jgi:hypothetical protein